MHECVFPMVRKKDMIVREFILLNEIPEPRHHAGSYDNKRLDKNITAQVNSKMASYCPEKNEKTRSEDHVSRKV